jgi:transposase InsO family protein
MAWQTMEVHEQRVRFVVAASRKEKPLSVLCAEFGISRPTGYCWLERYRLQGVGGIAERSRRPHRSPAQTVPEREQLVVEMRLRYPDWGAHKLQVLLKRDGLALTRSTIHRILLRHDLVREQDRNSPATERFERNAPNELWQMDFKGPSRWPQPVGPLSVLDDHSRYLIVLAANGSTHAGPVRQQLIEAFDRCGLPQAMLMDHGTPWWSTKSPSGRTHLSLWLMRQGIRLYWSGIRHPQTQGKVERFHGTLQRALDRRGTLPAELQPWLDAFRQEHNYVRPHEALAMQTPATRWQPSSRRYQLNPPRWEYPEGAWLLKIDSQGKLDLKGRKWRISKALSGEYVQIVPLEQRLMVFFCSTLLREIDLTIQRSTMVDRWIAQPITEPKL